MSFAKRLVRRYHPEQRHCEIGRSVPFPCSTLPPASSQLIANTLQCQNLTTICLTEDLSDLTPVAEECMDGQRSYRGHPETGKSGGSSLPPLRDAFCPSPPMVKSVKMISTFSRLLLKLNKGLSNQWSRVGKYLHEKPREKTTYRYFSLLVIFVLHFR